MMINIVVSIRMISASMRMGRITGHGRCCYVMASGARLDR